jgi:hypothetical protein
VFFDHAFPPVVPNANGNSFFCVSSTVAFQYAAWTRAVAS